MDSSGPRSDAELLAAHVAGDPEAFGLLFSRHRDRLWAVAVRTMGNQEDAADGLQDGLVAAWRRAGSFRGDAAVTTWLHRVVVNACLDRLRAAKVRAHDSLPDDLGERGDRGSLFTSTASSASPGSSGAPEDPADASVAHERRERVVEALRALPAEQRAALVLVDLEGYPVAEAAQILQCAPGTVKSRCSRGRARLAPMLADLVAPAPESGNDPPRNPPAPAPVSPVDPARGPPPPPSTRD